MSKRFYRVRYNDGYEDHYLYNIYYSVSDTHYIVDENGNILLYEDDTLKEMNKAIEALSNYDNSVEEIQEDQLPQQIKNI